MSVRPSARNISASTERSENLARSHQDNEIGLLIFVAIGKSLWEP